jgi:hypothetical protein
LATNAIKNDNRKSPIHALSAHITPTSKGSLVIKFKSPYNNFSIGLSQAEKESL